MLRHSHAYLHSVPDSAPLGKPRRRFFGWLPLAALLLSFALPALAPAQSVRTRVRGRVTDAQQSAIAGADVRLLPASGLPHSAPQNTVTNDAGEFQFDAVASGDYRLTLSKEGFESRTEPLRVAAADVELDLKLRIAAVHEGVIVTAKRQQGETLDSELPAAVVTRRELDRSLPVNLAQALDDVPGVMWRDAGSFRSRPVMRGLESNRMLILVDGERLNNGRTATDFGGIETSLVDVAQVEQVEIVRGPGSVLYGSDALGGVINIITPSAHRSDGPRFGADLGGEFFSNSDLRRGHADLFASNRWMSARAGGSLGYADAYASPAGPVFFSGDRDDSAFSELRVFPGKGHSLFAKLGYRGAYDFGLPDTDPQPAFLAYFPYSKLRKFDAGYTGNYDMPAFSALQVKFYQQGQNRNFSNLLTVPGFELFSQTVTRVSTWGADVQATSIASRKHVLTYGANFHRDANEDNRLQILFPSSLNLILSEAPSVPNSEMTGTGLYLQDQLDVNSRVRLTGGVRWDRYRLSASETPNFDPGAGSLVVDAHTDHAVSGNGAVAVRLADGWLLTGAVARAFREPNLFERYFFGRGSVGGFIVPNPDLKPESSVQFDVGMRTARGPVRLTFDYFLNRLTNLITTTPGTFEGQTEVGGEPVFQNTNIDRARIQGVESTAEVDVRGLGARWTPFISLAWQRGTNLTSAEPLSLIAPFVGTAGLRWQAQRLPLWSELRARVVASNDRIPAGFTPLQGYTVFAWRFGYEVVRGERGLGTHLPRGFAGMSFYAGIENLGNRLYNNLFDTVPEPGRTFRGGVRFHFDSSRR